MIVVKFGGTSLAGTERMRAAARIVAAQSRGQDVVCVVSAMAGTTDALIRAITQITTTGIITGRQIITAIREQHQQTLTELLTATTTMTGAVSTTTHRFEMAWMALEADLASLIADDFPSEDARTHARAAFSGWGERLSALLFATALAAEGVATQEMAEEPVVMAQRGLPAAPLTVSDERIPWEQLTPSVRKTREHLRALLSVDAHVTVAPGYLARTADGLVTTLGRNGSDASAAVIAAALGADELVIYSDVHGVRRADPRVVPEAALLPRLTYADAAEIAALGAQVLHPATLRPLAAAGIPLRLRSSFAPDAPGTDIGPAARLWDHDAPAPEWIVVAHSLTTTNPLVGLRADHALGLVEVTGLFLEHAELVAHEDDQFDAAGAANAPIAGQSMSQAGEGPVTGARALLEGSPRPFGLSLSARRISVAVQADESAATQRRLYSALAHADERSRSHARLRDEHLAEATMDQRRSS